MVQKSSVFDPILTGLIPKSQELEGLVNKTTFSGVTWQINGLFKLDTPLDWIYSHRNCVGFPCLLALRTLESKEETLDFV